MYKYIYLIFSSLTYVGLLQENRKYCVVVDKRKKGKARKI